jgi:hypothetical protein
MISLKLTLTGALLATALVSASGQTITDDFSSAAQWTSPVAFGFGNLTFTNSRLEYSVTGGSTGNLSYTTLATAVGSYTSNWTAQIDMHFVDFSTTDPTYADLALGAKKTGPALSPSAGGEINRGSSLIGSWETNSSETQITSSLTDLTMRLSFNSTTKVLTVDYSTGGSFSTITSYDLHTGGTDWGMTNSDTFTIFLKGNSGNDLTTAFGPLISGPDATFDNFSSVGMTAVPEPSTYAILVGAVSLGFAAYRRRPKRSV